MELDIQTAPLFNIESLELAKINQKFLIDWPNDGSNSVAKDSKENCKVLKFTANWTFKDALREVSELETAIFKNLFVFIINAKDVTEENKNNDEFCVDVVEHGVDDRSEQTESKTRKIDVKELLQENFVSFCKSRQIIIQLVSGNENGTKFFYNQESSMEVLREITNESAGDEQTGNFSSFLYQLLSKPDDESELNDIEGHDSSNDKENDRKLKLEAKIFDLLQNPEQLALRFLTIFDFPLEFSFHVLSHCAVNLSKEHFLAAFGVPFEDEEISLTNAQAKMICSVFESQKYKSLLEASIDNEKREIFDYLRTRECCFYIIRLPADHQIEISNKLVDKKKVDILCDLLETTDFLFPTDSAGIEHARFKKIVKERIDFHKAIEIEDYERIDNFIESNGENAQLEYIYNINNKSALHTALSANKHEVYLHLKEKNFRGNDIYKLKQHLMCENIKSLSFGYERAVQLLTDRSKISSKEKCQFQRDKVKAWLTAISKTKHGGALIKAAAQSEELQIVFDFERTDVAGIDLENLDADGIMYPGYKLVIIGAKHSTQKDEQSIKGVLAHELAHYVIRMIFQNREQPYFSESDSRYKKYKEVVEKYRYLTNENENDGCDNIISSVYRDYGEEDWDAEIIVRIFQIYVYFDDSPEKLDELLANFEDLDKFTEKEVVSQMNGHNSRAMEYVNIFNKCVEFRSKNLEPNLHFCPSDQVKNILCKKLTIVTSNVPKLFLIEMYNHLKEIHGRLVDGKNVFVSQKKLKGQDLLEAFKLIMDLKMEINIILDFSSGDTLQALDIPVDGSFIIVVKEQSQLMKLQQKFVNLKPSYVEIVYEWNRLEEKVKDQLLQRKVNFQGNTNIFLVDILGSDGDLTNIFDADIINQILNREEIKINSDIGLDENKFFKFLFRERYFEWQISQPDLSYVKNDPQFVIISDVAGSGKSWAMRNLALILSKSTNWVTFVDLKQFINNFMNMPSDANISNFIVDEVLKEKPNFVKEIFKWKYQKGEVKLLFDGFDEIAPNCAEFVLKLIKSFKTYGKNQLGVSTRNYFQVELKKELDVDLTFKLTDFSKNDGIELITMIWRSENNQVLMNMDKIESEEYENDKKLARELIEKLPKTKSSEIALPQIYSMIAKITKKKKKLDGDLNTFQLYRMMWDECHKEWFKSKGQIREKIHDESQYKELNSALHLHELKAMQRFAPGKSEYCDLDPNDEWEENELQGCGLMSKRGDGKFYFDHETFYEFFVAEFIMRNLRSKKRAKEAFGYMLKVIHDEKQEVIQKFLDEALEKESKEDKEKWIELLSKTSLAKKMNIRELCKAFIKRYCNINSLGRFLLDILKRENYKKFLKYFVEGIEELATGEKRKKRKVLWIFEKRRKIHSKSIVKYSSS